MSRTATIQGFGHRSRQDCFENLETLERVLSAFLAGRALAAAAARIDLHIR
jgi:hypothetical protein